MPIENATESSKTTMTSSVPTHISPDGGQVLGAAAAIQIVVEPPTSSNAAGIMPLSILSVQTISAVTVLPITDAQQR